MINNFKRFFIFQGLGDKEIDIFLENYPPIIKAFKRGELVYPISDNGNDVGFVIKGKCEVRRIRFDGSKTILNVLEENDSFGILSVFSAADYPTKIYALKNTTIAFFSADQIHVFIKNSSQISHNIIEFMAGRISFLNQKIATFSCSSVDERLSIFLLSERYRLKSDSFPLNIQKTSAEINAGRASVYRALESLNSQGLISQNNKIITIKDPEGLERITK